MILAITIATILAQIIWAQALAYVIAPVFRFELWVAQNIVGWTQSLRLVTLIVLAITTAMNTALFSEIACVNPV
jgi:hypothetical protein